MSNLFSSINIAIIIPFLILLQISCEEPKNDFMSINGRITDSTTGFPISKYLFEISYMHSGRTGLGNGHFGATRDLRTDSAGNFKFDFEISIGSNYCLRTYDHDTIYFGRQNSTLGDLKVLP